MAERLQKILARHGLGSRREIERWIVEGRVTVNRKPAVLGAQYTPGDRVAIDGKEVTARLSIEVEPQVLIYHKLQGQPIAASSQAKAEAGEEESGVEEEVPPARTDLPTVMEQLPAVRGSRWVPINPMHGGDSGLLLLTNDGNLGYALTRRKRWIPSGYMVRVLAPAPEGDGALRIAPELPKQLQYDDGRKSESIEFTLVEPAGGEGANLWYHVVLPRADRRAAVRALFESHSLKVSRMTQVAFGDIELPRDLPRGRHRALTAEQMASLYRLAELPPPVRKAAVDKPRKPPSTRGKRPAPDRRRAPKKSTRRR